MVLIYNLVVQLFILSIRLAAPFNRKARKWVDGRKGLWSRLESLPWSSDIRIWFHAASLGEFEQGRPLIELIRAKHPDAQILLTFFSPSGYESMSGYEGVDFIEYLPPDTRRNARHFIKAVAPSLSVFIKYEIWANFWKELVDNQIPTILISAQFRPKQWYFRSGGGFVRHLLSSISQIFTADVSSAQLLKDQGFENVTRCGDTRMDRVITIAEHHQDFGHIRRALGDGPVLVAGSTWPEDERMILNTAESMGYKLVIAPHEIAEKDLERVESLIKGSSVRFSTLTASDKQTYDAVIVDTMGHLSQIYHIGDVAYVGGGFGEGIHNVLEPVAHHLPVIFGPRFSKFREAYDLIEQGIGISVSSNEEFGTALMKFGPSASRSHLHSLIDTYIADQRGATDCIYAYIRANQLIPDAVAD